LVDGKGTGGKELEGLQFSSGEGGGDGTLVFLRRGEAGRTGNEKRFSTGSKHSSLARGKKDGLVVKKKKR